MRLRSVLSEALRNIGAGVSHALLMFAAVLFASTLLGGYEAANVVGLETEVLQRINAYADVGAPSLGERWTEPHVTGSPTLAAV